MNPSRLSTGALGVGVGATLMYFLDGRQGPSRRARLRNRLFHTMKREQSLLGKAGRDLRNRARGGYERARHSLDEAPSDAVLVERVRSHLGRVVSHPAAVCVDAMNGRIVLSGAVLSGEARELIQCVEAVPGVRQVINELEPHETAAGVPELQGRGHAIGRARRSGQWAPAPRLAIGAAAAGLFAWGSRRGSIVGDLAALAGAALIARITANRSWRNLIGAGSALEGVDIQKTITVAAPIDEVFALWGRLENFPRFMQHVQRIVVDGDGRSRWIVDGPGGIRIGFDAQVTRMIPNQVIAWETLPNQAIQHRGTVHFEPADVGTRVHVQMQFLPPAGLLGHSVAKIFGWDPKHRMDEDLMRMKGLLELGRTRAHHRRITVDDMA